MKSKRFLASLLALLMLFSLMPTLALAEGDEDEGQIVLIEAEPEDPTEPEEPAEPEAQPEGDELQADPVAYDLWICGVQVTDRNKNMIVGGVSYDPESATVTITGAGVSTFQNPAGLYNGAVIYSELPDLTILTKTGITVNSDEASSLIYVNGGSLTLSTTTNAAPLTLNSASARYGIYVAGGDLVLDTHLTITAAAAEYGICVSNGDLVVDQVLNAVPVVLLYSMKNGVGISNGTITGSTGMSNSVVTVNGKRISYSAPTLQGDSVTNAMVITDGDLGLGGTLTVRSNSALYGVYAPNGAVTSEGTLNVMANSSGMIANIYAEYGFTATGNVDVDGSSNFDYYGTGILCPNGSVDISGNFSSATKTGIDCAGGDVTVGGYAAIQCGSWSDDSYGIRVTNGGNVDLGSLWQSGTIHIVVYAEGDITVRGAVEIVNAFPIGGEGIRSVNGKVICKSTVTIAPQYDDEFNNTDVFIYAGGTEGILIEGATKCVTERNVEVPAAFMAPNGPITVNGNLSIVAGGLTTVLAKGDITVKGSATIKNELSQTTVKPYDGKAICSTEGSIIVTRNLTSTSSDSGVYAAKDITVGGNATAGVSIQNERDYILKAEAGELKIDGTLSTTGLASTSAFGGTGITVGKNVSINNAAEDAIGMYSDGTVTFVTGVWDVDAGKQAILAKEGIEIPTGFGVTFPEGGKVAQLDGAYAVTDADGAVAPHAIIEEQALITITFDLNYEGGEPIRIQIPQGGSITQFPEITEYGEAPTVWKLVGWYTEAASGVNVGKLGEKITAETSFNADTTVYAHWYLPGDINGDGSVDNKDVTRLIRYIKYGDVEAVEYALDPNLDGATDNKDVTRLIRYIKYGDVEIF